MNVAANVSNTRRYQFKQKPLTGDLMLYHPEFDPSQK